jgi:hypothetical protein
MDAALPLHFLKYLRNIKNIFSVVVSDMRFLQMLEVIMKISPLLCIFRSTFVILREGRRAGIEWYWYFNYLARNCIPLLSAAGFCAELFGVFLFSNGMVQSFIDARALELDH